MCEKNFEGKVLSPPSSDEDDILEETIIDNDVKDDLKEVIIEPPKPKKRSKKKKTIQKICKTCGEDIIQNEDRDVLRFTNTYHQLSAKNYCKEHVIKSSNHKCKPSWCGECGFLMKYEIVVKYDK